MIIKVKKHWSFVKTLEYGDVHEMLSIKLRAKSNVNIVQKINKCFCFFLTSP